MNLRIPMAGALGCGPDCSCQTSSEEAESSLLEEILGSTRAWCPDCRQAEPALYSCGPAGVFLERLCPQRGSRKIKIALTREWFEDRLAGGIRIDPPEGGRPVQKGCPQDCGLCRAHLGRLRLPIFSITNQCQLACPICFTHNRTDLVYHKSLADVARILEAIEEKSVSLDLINLTGGEPTLHPELALILKMCAARSFGQVSVNTNGLKLAESEELAEMILESGAEVVLSLDTLDPRTSRIIHGADIVRSKLAALARLERLNIPTVLLPVWIPGVNDQEIPQILKSYFSRPFVKGITIQTITYTGFYGSRFAPKTRATLEEVENGLKEAGFRAEDFFRPGACHALCYSAAYYLADGAALISLSRLADKNLLSQAASESYLIKPNEELVREIRNKIDEFWAGGASQAELRLLKKLVSSLTGPGPGREGAAEAAGDSSDRDRGFLPEAGPGPGREGAAEAAGDSSHRAYDFQKEAVRRSGLIKTVTLHAHMDEDNFDLARAALCGDLVPEEDRTFRPACAYNLLYRADDPRFWAEDAS
ncbi:MAG: radical SAM protein [Deltaproteobacteria bacterium]|jgi:molybdenum cofactor biosynthesis enzyme MoaA|nr:radical SAM protein [Deltaproteobacteria bacterium]